MIVSKTEIESRSSQGFITKGCVADQPRVGSNLRSCFPGSVLTEFNSTNRQVVCPDRISEPERIPGLPFQNPSQAWPNFGPQAKSPRACSLSSKSESAYIKISVTVLICDRIPDVDSSTGMNFPKRIPKNQRINQTSQDAVLEHVNIDDSLRLEKSRPPEELALKRQCRPTDGLSHFLLKLSSRFQLTN
jgi:hypothetical protein